MTLAPGIKHLTHWWEASALTTVPSLLHEQIQSSLKVSEVLSENVPNSKDFSDIFTGTSQDVFLAFEADEH